VTGCCIGTLHRTACEQRCLPQLSRRRRDAWRFGAVRPPPFFSFYQASQHRATAAARRLRGALRLRLFSLSQAARLGSMPLWRETAARGVEPGALDGKRARCGKGRAKELTTPTYRAFCVYAFTCAPLCFFFFCIFVHFSLKGSTWLSSSVGFERLAGRHKLLPAGSRRWPPRRVPWARRTAAVKMPQGDIAERRAG